MYATSSIANRLLVIVLLLPQILLGYPGASPTGTVTLAAIFLNMKFNLLKGPTLLQ